MTGTVTPAAPAVPGAMVLTPADGTGLAGPLRRERMVELIRHREFVRVGELADSFAISEVTVRSDLHELASAGLVRRVRGGASAVRRSSSAEPTFEQAMGAAAEQKRDIGRAAARLVTDGTSVLLDVGTTTTCVARELARREDLLDVTVLTNGMNIALELEKAVGRISVVLLGGTLRPRQHSLVEPLATVLLEQIHADLALIGCNGVDAVAGITNVNLPEAVVKRRMIASARTVVVVADGSKIGRVELSRVADVSDIDLLLTTSDADPDAVARLRRSGLEVRWAAP